MKTPIRTRGLRWAVLAGLVGAALAVCALVPATPESAGAATKPGDNRVNMNEIQTIKTHNGYGKGDGRVG